MLCRVIAKNVRDVFFETQCSIQWRRRSPGIENRERRSSSHGVDFYPFPSAPHILRLFHYPHTTQATNNDPVKELWDALTFM